MRGATVSGRRGATGNMHFNPRAPCGARRCEEVTLPWIIYFNPRAPCGARRTVRSPVIGANAFQSTRPMRGATNDWGTGSFDWEISIHAPHAGRDGSDTEAPASLFRFQSTRPMRGATGLFILIWASVIFQSTRPMRGATNHWKEFNGENTISIHAPHAGRDPV